MVQSCKSCRCNCIWLSDDRRGNSSVSVVSSTYLWVRHWGRKSSTSNMKVVLVGQREILEAYHPQLKVSSKTARRRALTVVVLLHYNFQWLFFYNCTFPVCPSVFFLAVCVFLCFSSVLCEQTYIKVERTKPESHSHSNTRTSRFRVRQEQDETVVA